MNADWHRAHPLDRGASRLERLIWHTEHERACGCRPLPDSLLRLIDRPTPPERPELSRKQDGDPTRSAERDRYLAEVRRLSALLPDVVEKPAYGSPAWYRKKQFFARLHEAGPLVVKVSWDLRDRLRRLDAKTFFITPHYRDYPMLLVERKGLRKGELEAVAARRRSGEPKREAGAGQAQRVAPQCLMNCGG